MGALEPGSFISIPMTLLTLWDSNGLRTVPETGQRLNISYYIGTAAKGELVGWEQKQWI